MGDDLSNSVCVSFGAPGSHPYAGCVKSLNGQCGRLQKLRPCRDCDLLCCARHLLGEGRCWQCQPRFVLVVKLASASVMLHKDFQTAANLHLVNSASMERATAARVKVADYMRGGSAVRKTDVTCQRCVGELADGRCASCLFHVCRGCLTFKGYRVYRCPTDEGFPGYCNSCTKLVNEVVARMDYLSRPVDLTNEPS